MTTHGILVGTFLTLATAYGASIAAEQRVTDTQTPTIDVVGCIQRTDQPGTLATIAPEPPPTPEPRGTSGNLAQPGPAFTLIHATPAPARASKEPAAESSSTEAPRRFILFGNEGELAKHDGHRVRVTGMLEPSTKPAESGAVGTSGSVQPKPQTLRLKVTSIGMVAGDCSPL